jgi:hypothetical protein
MKWFAALAALALVALALVAVLAPQRSGPPVPTPLTETSTVETATTAAATATTCYVRGVLPDPVCTPGATDPRVTQDTLTGTVCVAGYTKTVRPPASYTDAIKRDQMRAYGFTGAPADYEEDHLIPLALGGHPTDPRNLWPQARRSIGGRAEDKDQIEDALHRDLCAGRITLADAQRRIAADWTTAR